MLCKFCRNIMAALWDFELAKNVYVCVCVKCPEQMEVETKK